MTSTRTAIWNLLKRERRGALRAGLGQSLLLVIAACGGGAEPPGSAGSPNTGAPTSPVAGTPATPTAGNGAKPNTPSTGTAGKPATPPTTTGTAGGGAKPPTTSGAAGAPTTPATGTAGAAGSTTPSSGAAGGGSDQPDGTPTAGAGGSGTPTTPGGSDDLTGESSCLAKVTSGFDQEGPFQFMQEREGSINFWVPMVDAGCKVPVIHLANGTGANCSSYGRALERFASHGFLTACYENPNTGAGTQGLEALQTALTKYPNLAAKRFGSTGHSQGGQSTFIVQSLAEEEFGLEGTKFAGLAMQPATNFGSQPQGGWQMHYKRIKSPMFMFSGRGTDGLVSQGWVQDAFDALDPSIEKYHWTKQGGAHIPTPQGEEMQIGPAWFRWKLLGDKAACEFFKSIPMTDNTWEEVAVENAAPCE